MIPVVFLGRRYGGTRGSRKPDSIPSSMWVNLSKKQKEKAIEDEAREAARKEFDFQEGALLVAVPNLPPLHCQLRIAGKLSVTNL